MRRGGWRQSRLPADVSLRDLGWHRLKDIEAPERIYQLAVAGLQDGSRR